jgi:hypothetical protein
MRVARRGEGGIGNWVGMIGVWIYEWWERDWLLMVLSDGVCLG